MSSNKKYLELKLNYHCKQNYHKRLLYYGKLSRNLFVDEKLIANSAKERNPPSHKFCTNNVEMISFLYCVARNRGCQQLLSCLHDRCKSQKFKSTKLVLTLTVIILSLLHQHQDRLIQAQSLGTIVASGLIGRALSRPTNSYNTLETMAILQGITRNGQLHNNNNLNSAFALANQNPLNPLSRYTAMRSLISGAPTTRQTLRAPVTAAEDVLEAILEKLKEKEKEKGKKGPVIKKVVIKKTILPFVIPIPIKKKEVEYKIVEKHVPYPVYQPSILPVYQHHKKNDNARMSVSDKQFIDDRQLSSNESKNRRMHSDNVELSDTLAKIKKQKEAMNLIKLQNEAIINYQILKEIDKERKKVKALKYSIKDIPRDRRTRRKFDSHGSKAIENSFDDELSKVRPYIMSQKVGVSPAKNYIDLDLEAAPMLLGDPWYNSKIFNESNKDVLSHTHVLHHNASKHNHISLNSNARVRRDQRMVERRGKPPKVNSLKYAPYYRTAATSPKPKLRISQREDFIIFDDLSPGDSSNKQYFDNPRTGNLHNITFWKHSGGYPLSSNMHEETVNADYDIQVASQGAKVAKAPSYLNPPINYESFDLSSERTEIKPMFLSSAPNSTSITVAPQIANSAENSTIINLKNKLR